MDNVILKGHEARGGILDITILTFFFSLHPLITKIDGLNNKGMWRINYCYVLTVLSPNSQNVTSCAKCRVEVPIPDQGPIMNLWGAIISIGGRLLVVSVCGWLI